jgi:hypothetical protein
MVEYEEWPEVEVGFHPWARGAEELYVEIFGVEAGLWERKLVGVREERVGGVGTRSDGGESSWGTAGPYFDFWGSVELDVGGG